MTINTSFLGYVQERLTNFYVIKLVETEETLMKFLRTELVETEETLLVAFSRMTMRNGQGTIGKESTLICGK